jgi:hypothetical protein
MRFIILISLLSIIIGLGACYKKYPEDDFISFRSPKNRLTNYYKLKKWYFKKAKIDGVDATEEYKKNNPFHDWLAFNATWDCEEGSTIYARRVFEDTVYYNMECKDISLWQFSDDKTKIEMNSFLLYPNDIRVDSSRSPKISYWWNTQNAEYTIVKLTNKKLVLESFFKNKTFLLEYER